MSDKNREQMMVASYLGGCSIATSYVGVVHPFSAGLSTVLDLPHCLANCITMRAVGNFYPNYYDEFWRMAETQNIQIPTLNLKTKKNLSNILDTLYKSTIIHEKPLTNALGENFRKILTRDKVEEMFMQM